MSFLAISLQIPENAPARRTAPVWQPVLLTLGIYVALGATCARAQAPAQAPAPSPVSSAESNAGSGEITEDQLKQRLVGKQLFLRGGYLGDSISFNQRGEPTGHPTPGSYTLSAIEIEKINLTKHKLELEGYRYALHFLGAMPYEDPSKAVDRVKITPKKKVLKITIDREQVIKPKKEKSKDKDKRPTPNAAAPSAETPDAPVAAAEEAAEQAADPKSVTTTTSPAHAAQVLREALDQVFAQGLDEKVRAQMPEFWQLYYQAQAAGVDYHSKDPAVLRSTAVDQQAKLISAITPDSNEFAQANGIAGRALYRAVIGADGKPAEIAVVRPIGFGLDENAVAAIRKATFQPATKGGQPVAESLDLAVLFRIYSKRTAVAGTDATQGDTAKPADHSTPVKPGPYSVKAPQTQP